jgi:hypothetical protein
VVNKRTSWVFVVITAFTMAAVGCASSGTSKPVAASDLPALTGTWTGWISLPTGGSVPGTWELSPGGDYVTRAGAFTAQGKVQVKEGALVLTSTSGTGSLGTNQRSATAVLSERADGMLVLRGHGHSDAGPFDFEVVRQK